MINIRTLRKLTNNDGLTLKNGKIINYKSGWQVATEGKETTDIREAMKMIKEYCGNYLYEIDGFLSNRELMCLVALLFA